MSPLATYMYKPEPKSRRGVETITKYVQKQVVGKIPYRHLTRKGKKESARATGIGGRGTSSRIFAPCDSGLVERNVSEINTSNARSTILTVI